MAIVEHYNHGIINDLHGKLGGFVIYQRLGKICVRHKPDGYKPSGATQLAQQRRLASVNILYKALNAVGLAGYWKEADKPLGWSGYNLFVSRNIPAFDPDGLIGDAEKVCLTPGTGVYLPDEMTVRKEEEGIYVLAWKNATCYPTNDDADRVVLALMQGRDRFGIKLLDKDGIACRGDGSVRFEIPVKLRSYGNLYCFMQSATGLSVSASKHFRL